MYRRQEDTTGWWNTRKLVCVIIGCVITLLLFAAIVLAMLDIGIPVLRPLKLWLARLSAVHPSLLVAAIIGIPILVGLVMAVLSYVMSGVILLLFRNEGGSTTDASTSVFDDTQTDDDSHTEQPNHATHGQQIDALPVPPFSSTTSQSPHRVVNINIEAPICIFKQQGITAGKQLQVSGEGERAARYEAVKNATKAEYKQLALKYHPDKQNGDTTQFQYLQLYYTWLNDGFKKSAEGQFFNWDQEPDFTTPLADAAMEELNKNIAEFRQMLMQVRTQMQEDQKYFKAHLADLMQQWHDDQTRAHETMCAALDQQRQTQLDELELGQRERHEEIQQHTQDIRQHGEFMHQHGEFMHKHAEKLHQHTDELKEHIGYIKGCAEVFDQQAKEMRQASNQIGQLLEHGRELEKEIDEDTAKRIHETEQLKEQLARMQAARAAENQQLSISTPVPTASPINAPVDFSIATTVGGNFQQLFTGTNDVVENLLPFTPTVDPVSASASIGDEAKVVNLDL